MARPRTPNGRARVTNERLKLEYPEARCELDHANAFQLLTATILSAQTTDVRVNMVTPALFARYPTAEDLAAADPAEVEVLIKSTGFYRNKTKSIIGMAQALVDRFGGEVPGAMRDLVTVPGVGRKTANVVRSVALGLPGLPVDTHVGRLSRRIGLTTETDPVKVELELNPMVPASERGEFSLRLILHGRRICVARSPRCEDCVLNDFCPSATVPNRSKPRVRR
jgi:endonuclease III